MAKDFKPPWQLTPRRLGAHGEPQALAPTGTPGEREPPSPAASLRWLREMIEIDEEHGSYPDRLEHMRAIERYIADLERTLEELSK